LLTTHVVIVVVLQVLFRPGRVEVRTPMLVQVVHRGVPDSGREPRRDRKERRMREHQRRHGQRFLALRMLPEHRPLVVWIEEIVLPTGAVVLAPVEAEEAFLLLAEPVQDIFVDQPLTRVRVEKPEGDA
jgi:hypothetical protein